MSNPNTNFLFGKTNFMIAGAGLLLMIIGYILMSGSEDIYSTTKITVAPILVIAGFVLEVVAILYRDKSKQGQ